MNATDVGWAGLLLILLVLGWMAREFTRRTFRTAVLVVVAFCAIMVTCYGLAQRGKPSASFGAAFDLGGGRLEQAMLGPLLPGGYRVLPGLAGWISLLVLLGAILVYFDAVCTRREQPRVQASQTPAMPTAAGYGPAPADGSAPGLPRPAPDGGPGPEIQATVTERLQFRLPAVEVRQPAVMPGGSTLENLAAVVSESGVQGSKATAALMRAIRAVEAQPRAYEARLLVEPCDAIGQVGTHGDRLRITVDLRDIRNDQSVVVRMLPPCRPGEAAERVAGFTARQVFRQDVATPSWAVGSADGEDLSAYLLARQKSPQGRTFRDRYDCRQRQRKLLERAVVHSSNAGAVQYDLAGLCDLDGHNLESLLLHLDNRVHHPRFLRGRYRLALSLSMLSTPDLFRREWCGRGDPPATEPYRDRAAVKNDVIRALRRSGLLRTLSDAERRALTGEADLYRSVRPRCGQVARAAQVALLRLAWQELRGYQSSLRPWSLAWSGLRHRAERASLLALLRGEPCWWRHPRCRQWAASFSREIIEQRIDRLRDDPRADARLATAQDSARRLLGYDAVASGGKPWVYGKAPWQAVYNAACMHAQPRSGNRPPTTKTARVAIALLRLAISDQACELVRPSEWIATDPDLRWLRGNAEFTGFVRDQASKDFAPAKRNEVGDPWFRRQLPLKEPGRPAETPPDEGSEPRGQAQMTPDAMLQPRRSEDNDRRPAGHYGGPM